MISNPLYRHRSFGALSFKSIRCIAISDVMKGISRDQTRVSADTVNLDDYTEVY